MSPTSTDAAPAAITIPETVHKKRTRVGISIGRQTLIALAKSGGIEGKPGSFALTVVTAEGLAKYPISAFVGINDSYDLTLTRELFPDERDKVALRIALKKAMSNGQSLEQILAELDSDNDTEDTDDDEPKEG